MKKYAIEWAFYVFIYHLMIISGYYHLGKSENSIIRIL